MNICFHLENIIGKGLPEENTTLGRWKYCEKGHSENPKFRYIINGKHCEVDYYAI